MKIFTGDNKIRESYNDAITQKFYSSFIMRFKGIHDNGQSIGPVLAKEAYEARHHIKSMHQAETSLIGKLGIAAHNFFKYGSISNPSFEYFMKNTHKTSEDIAYNAFKTDGSDLGLKNNGFNKFLAEARELDVHPEDLILGAISYEGYHEDNVTSEAHEDSSIFQQEKWPIDVTTHDWSE